MSKTLDIAKQFFETCESGQGWEACAPYCRADASFSCQSGALGEVSTLAQYAEWMKGMQGVMPDAAYEIKAVGEDTSTNSAVVFAVFTGTHTGQGGPVEATGKSTVTDYCLIMRFEGDIISGVTKVWNDAFAMGQLGWV